MYKIEYQCITQFPKTTIRNFLQVILRLSGFLKMSQYEHFLINIKSAGFKIVQQLVENISETELN